VTRYRCIRCDPGAARFAVQPVKRGYHPARNSRKFRRQGDRVAERAVPVRSEIPQPEILRKIGMEFNTEPARREPGDPSPVNTISVTLFRCRPRPEFLLPGG
jgi:hypothetical protein